MLNRLTYFCLIECGFTGPNPSFMGNMSGLKYLDVSYNFDLERGQLGEWIGNLRGLETLGLGGVNLSTTGGPISSRLLSLPHLRNLWLSYNLDLKVNLFSIVQHSRQLEMLDLSWSNVAGVIPPSIGNLSTLQSLHLSGNSLTGSILWTLGVQKLPELDLGSNQLNGSLPSSFGNLSSLVWLDLSNNFLSGIIPPSIEQLSSLISLSLDHNNFHGTFLLSVLANLTELTQLYLSSNNMLTVKVNGFWIPKFQLQRLGLRSCNMEGDFPIFISTQYDIEYLELSNNSLKGDIPNCLWDVTYLYNLQFLDLSMNLFDRFAPAKIGKNQQPLVFLSLAKNNLHGGIPHSIYEGQLEVLDLSNNKLSGKISESIGNFSSTL
ncbi:hypothetical protein KI387_022527 [Taxus chinensis]|uniref:Uncharacterized protein n=1 Tax=Taxus chinensis TaxID=29808 RepID=A0AA38G186_TAXCH|nr:hypothetical protein KI387_022527 [Taxus chinensis]